MIKTTDFAETLSTFLTIYLPGQVGFSQNTILSYRDTFKLMLSYAKESRNLKPERMTLCDFNVHMVEDFLVWIEKERGGTPSTRNQRLSALRSFARYAMSKKPEFIFEAQRILSLKTKKCAETELPHLTTEFVKEILEQPDVSDKYGRRDRVLLSLLYDSGARVQEICDLKIRDIRLNKPYSVVLTGKGKRVRAVPLMKNTVDGVSKYLKENNLNLIEYQNEFVFTNHRREQLTRAGITYILKKYCDMARKKNPLIPTPITPHIFRHSKAMHMLQAGINLVYIRDFLGHSRITTTEVYARADTEIKRHEMEKAMIKVTPDLPDWANDKALMSFLTSLHSD